MLYVVLQPTVCRLQKNLLLKCTQFGIRQHTKSAAAAAVTSSAQRLTRPPKGDRAGKKKSPTIQPIATIQYAAACDPKPSDLTVLPKSTDILCPSLLTKEDGKNQNFWRENGLAEVSNLLPLYLKLSKIRLTSLVVLTSMAGYAMAPAPVDLTTLVMATVGTGLTSCAANAINQFLEVPFDSQMSRTRNRVLVQGRASPLHAVVFAATSATLGISTLYYGCNGLTAALGASNLVLYTMIYTPMKRVSILNTWIGSVVGALPPLMGWAACSGQLDPAAWILAGMLYAWQFPHFNALSWNLRPDYSRAGYRMMSVTNPGLCRRTALRYTGAIILLSCGAPVLELTNYWFALESLPLNAYFAYLAYKFYRNSDSNSSRKLFRFSLIHLPALMLLLLINKKTWFIGKSKQEETSQKIENISVLAPVYPTNPDEILNQSKIQFSNLVAPVERRVDSLL